LALESHSKSPSILDTSSILCVLHMIALSILFRFIYPTATCSSVWVSSSPDWALIFFLGTHSYLSFQQNFYCHASTNGFRVELFR
jgi:hypothetical protein